MTTKNCLNCDKELTDKFCAGCGQKADTHRITFKNFIFHDILHGTFHIDKGILYTARQSLLRPGKAALEYISGKRKPYYNVFYLILIMVGLMLFFRHIDELFYPEQIATLPKSAKLDATSEKLNEIISQRSKYIIFLFVPLAAINTFILFRRKKLNLSEHSILSGMILLGIILLSIFTNFFFTFNLTFGLSNTAASILVTVLIFAYVIYGYINAFSADYSRLGMVFRMLMFFVFLYIELRILLYLIVGFITDWKMVEKVTLSTF